MREQSGCGKVVWVGCGVLFVLLGIGVVIFALNAQRLLDFIMDGVEEEVFRQMPSDVSDEDQERLRRAFSEADAAMARRDIDDDQVKKLTQMQRTIGEVSQKLPQGLEKRDVEKLTVALEEFAGIPPPETP